MVDPSSEPLRNQMRQKASAVGEVQHPLISRDMSSQHTTGSRSSSMSSKKRQGWLPRSLSRTYLLSLAVTSLALSICCFALVAYSRMHDGFSDAGSSGGFKFNQRFLPTLAAVVYTLLWSPVVVDVIRTEPWALISLPAGSKAQDSLLQTDKMWWSHVRDALWNKTRFGGTRWALAIAVLASLTSSIAINPLSAGLFDTTRYIVTTDRQFSGVVATKSGDQAPRIGDVIYLRAIANILFNVSTSAWNTDQYTVAPFWPSNVDNVPMTATVASSPQVWGAQRDIFFAKMDCRPFTIVRNSTGTGFRPEMVTDDGCAVKYDKTQGTSPEHGSWGQINNDTSPLTLDRCTAKSYREYFYFVSPKTTSDALVYAFGSERSYFKGQVCSTTYLTAKIPVSISTTSSRSEISIDQGSFLQSQRPMNSTHLDVTAFESEFIRQTGSNHLKPNNGTALNRGGLTENHNFRGPALVLASGSNYSIDNLMSTSPEKLAQQAAVIKQRFLGEVLLSSYSKLIEMKKTENFKASITQSQTRLVMDLGLGITVGILFLLLAGCAAGLSSLVSFNKRPLHLLADPSKATTAAISLVDSESASCFEGLDKATCKHLKRTLKEQTFSLQNGNLIRTNDGRVEKVAKNEKTGYLRRQAMKLHRRTSCKRGSIEDWRPFTLMRRSGTILTLLLLCIMAALVAVYAVSRKRPLYQSAFVYESELKVGKLNVTTLAPYSIIPTLIAVGIKLWWATIDSAHRRLAPFLAMARQPGSTASSGAGLTFMATPIVWVTLKAFRKGYWVLALVTFGTLISEVLQISMAALWNREPGVLETDLHLSSQWEIRSIPHVFENSIARFRSGESIFNPMIAQNLYGGKFYQTSWIYSGLAELAFGASSPAWSKDGWNFPPIDLSGVSKSLPKTTSKKDADAAKTNMASSANVSTDTKGLRGRVECTPIEADWTRWMVEVKNISGLRPYELSSNANLPNISSGFELLPEVRVMNFTKLDQSRPATVAIGQWLHSNYSSHWRRGSPLYSPSNSANFSVLWIEATYPYRFKTNITNVGLTFDLPPRLIFSRKPTVQALNCRPIFETAKARVVVSSLNGKVGDVAFHESPKPAPEAWSDNFSRHFSNGTAYYDPKNFDLEAVDRFNSTVSWGYLFQLALLQACNVQGLVTGTGENLGDGIPGATPFSFIEPDLYSDPFSYASLALVNYNRTALLDAATLNNVTQRVFSTFFQWFTSSRSGYKDDFWAYQPIGAKLPSGLDFGGTESLTVSTRTGSVLQTTCEQGTSSFTRTYVNSRTSILPTTYCIGPTLSSLSYWTIVTSYMTIVNTSTTTSSSSISQKRTSITPVANRTATSSSTRPALSRSTSPTPTLRAKRAPPTSSPNLILAKVSIPTETLVISRSALFLSVGILIILIIITITVYITHTAQLQLLPRDFDSPASLLAAVYASEGLKKYAQMEYERENQAAFNEKGGWFGLGLKRRSKTQAGPKDAGEEVHVRLGHFRGADGEEHWGIEVEEKASALLAGSEERVSTDAEPRSANDELGTESCRAQRGADP